MADLIDRQTALNALCDNCDTVQAVCPHFPCKRYTSIEVLPSAQPQTAERTEKSAQNVPNSDLISRKASIDALVEELAYKPEGYWDSGLNRYDVEVVLNQQPAADVATVRHGHWIEDGYFDYEIVCDQCGAEALRNKYNGEYYKSDFCPNCGARMDGEQDG